jgi:uncharacterized protein
MIRIGCWALLLAVLLPCAAAATVPAGLDQPELMRGHFERWARLEFDRVLQAYAEAGPTASRAVARCRFVEGFAYSDELDWSDEAHEVLEACRAGLLEDFGDEPDALLYDLGHRHGAEAVAAGEPLLERSLDWPPATRARLHEQLADAYLADHAESKADAQALLAVELDPGSAMLPRAIRALGAAGRADEARELAEAAPLAANAWLASQRVDALLAIDRVDAALAEIARAEAAGQSIEDRVLARAWLASGDIERAVTGEFVQRAGNRWESSDDRRLRFEVALAAGRVDLAGRALAGVLGTADGFDQLLGGYVRLLHLTPSAAAHPALLQVTLIAVGTLLALWLMPGLVLVPAHYRGLARRAGGRAPTPLFARIGLRQAWLAFAAFLSVPLLVAAVVAPAGFGALLGGGARLLDNAQVAESLTWGTVGCLLVLSPLLRRFDAGELLGRQRWGGMLLQVAGLWLLLLALSFAIGALAGQAQQDTDQTRMVRALTLGLDDQWGSIAAFTLIALLVPLLEELVFRGALLGGLARHVGFGWANAVQALVFALVHNDPPRFLFYLAMGLACGWLVRRSGGLAAPLLLHGLNNAFFVTVMLLQRGAG